MTSPGKSRGSSGRRGLGLILLALLLGSVLLRGGLSAAGMPVADTHAPIPAASLVLLAVLTVAVLKQWPPPAPQPGAVTTLILIAFSLGLLGTPRHALPPALPEIVQMVQIFVISAYATRLLRRIAHPWPVWPAVAAATLLLLMVYGRVGSPPNTASLSPVKVFTLAVMGTPFLIAAAGCAGHLVRAAAGYTLAVVFGLCAPPILPLATWLLTFTLSARWMRVLPWGTTAACALLAVAASFATAGGRDALAASLTPRYDAAHLKRSIIDITAAARAPRHYPAGGGPGTYRETINELKLQGNRVPHPDDQTVARDSTSQYAITLVELGLPAMLALLALPLAGLRRRHPSPAPPASSDSSAASGNTGDPRAAALALAVTPAIALWCTVLSRGTGLWLGVLLGCLGPPARYGSRSRKTASYVLVGAAFTITFVAAAVLNNGQAESPRPSRVNRFLQDVLYGGEAADTLDMPVIRLPDPLTGKLANRTVVRIEAEACDDHVAPFRKGPDDKASGRMALVIPDGTAKGVGHATFCISIPRAGRYVLFARVRWKDACGNSLRFEIGDRTVLLADGIFGHWHEVDARVPVDLQRGATTIRVHNVEDGVALDYWGLRNSSSGPVASEPGLP